MVALLPYEKPLDYVWKLMYDKVLSHVYANATESGDVSEHCISRLGHDGMDWLMNNILAVLGRLLDLNLLI